MKKLTGFDIFVFILALGALISSAHLKDWDNVFLVLALTAWHTKDVWDKAKKD